MSINFQYGKLRKKGYILHSLGSREFCAEMEKKLTFEGHLNDENASFQIAASFCK